MWHVLGRPQKPQNLRSSFRRPWEPHTPPQAAFKGVPLAWPWYLPRPHKLFLLGFETATWHVLGRPQKPQNLRSSFGRPWNLTTLCSNFRRRAACLAMVSKLLCGTFWAGLESLKTSAAAFEGLRTSQPSAAAFRGVPLAWPWYLPRPHKLLLWACGFYWASKLLCGTFWAGLESLKTSAAAFAGVRTSHPSAAAFEGMPLAWPWYLPRPHKLFLLGVETAMWHVLGTPQKPQNFRSSFRRRPTCLAMVPP